jgi:hypothetical protein
MQAQQAQETQQLVLADLQLRVLEEAGATANPVLLALTLQSAALAQAATPPCAER